MTALPVLPRVDLAVTLLRCHHCSHAVGTSARPMRLAGIFKASLLGRVGRSHADEVRKRCRSCGWVNVFHPVPAAGPAIEVKG